MNKITKQDIIIELNARLPVGAKKIFNNLDNKNIYNFIGEFGNIIFNRDKQAKATWIGYFEDNHYYIVEYESGSSPTHIKIKLKIKNKKIVDYTCYVEGYNPKNHLHWQDCGIDCQLCSHHSGHPHIVGSGTPPKQVAKLPPIKLKHSPLG